MEVWPQTLPLFKADGSQFQKGVRGRRFEVDGGRAKQRITVTRAIDQSPLQLECTESEMNALDEFEEDVGADWFSITHPRTGESTHARFVVDKPTQWVARAPYWVATIFLEFE